MRLLGEAESTLYYLYLFAMIATEITVEKLLIGCFYHFLIAVGRVGTYIFHKTRELLRPIFYKYTTIFEIRKIKFRSLEE